MTRLVALLGKPLRRRHSVVMHNAAFAAAGIDAEYVLRELDEGEVPEAVAAARGAGWLGLGVTAPYKPLVAELVDEVDPAARQIGAVNNVVRTEAARLVGFNSDAPGFEAAAERALGRPLAGLQVVVAGAGGAARAVAYACLAAGVSRITVGARSRERPQALLWPWSGIGLAVRAGHGLDDRPFRVALERADLAVNATTVGMIDPGLPFPVDGLRPDATVFDCVYVPAETPLLAAARARGLRAVNGSEMLIHQAAIAFERWTGIAGMDGVMRDAVAPLLADSAVRA